MNAKLIGLVIASIVFASGALAGQVSGRDSVYAEAGNTGTKSALVAKSAPVAAVNGRSSVYATDLPAPTPKGDLKVARLPKPGRA